MYHKTILETSKKLKSASISDYSFKKMLLNEELLRVKMMLTFISNKSDPHHQIHLPPGTGPDVCQSWIHDLDLDVSVWFQAALS